MFHSFFFVVFHVKHFTNFANFYRQLFFGPLWHRARCFCLWCSQHVFTGHTSDEPKATEAMAFSLQLETKLENEASKRAGRCVGPVLRVRGFHASDNEYSQKGIYGHLNLQKCAFNTSLLLTILVF